MRGNVRKRMTMNEPLKIGSTIWKFDQNRRVYEKNGRGGPIYRKHWVEVKILRETTRSWVIDYWGSKVPKKGPHPGYAFTQEELEDDIWVKDTRYEVVQAVESCKDANILRQIAALVRPTIPTKDTNENT